MYLCPLLEVRGKAPVWSLAIHPSARATVMKTQWVLLLPNVCCGMDVASTTAFASSSSVGAWLRGLPLFEGLEVDLTPLGKALMWPALVASSTPMYLLISLALRPGKPLR